MVSFRTPFVIILRIFSRGNRLLLTSISRPLTGLLPCPVGHLLQIQGSESKHRLHRQFFKSPQGCPTHAMLFFCICEYALNGFLSLRINFFYFWFMPQVVCFFTGTLARYGGLSPFDDPCFLCIVLKTGRWRRCALGDLYSRYPSFVVVEYLRTSPAGHK